MRQRVLGRLSRVRRGAKIGAALLLGAALAQSACGEHGDGAPFDESKFLPGEGGSAPSTGAGGDATSGGGGDDIGFDAGLGGSTGSGLEPDAACAASVTSGKVVPVTMFIMFDKSGSMADEDKWIDATSALTSFFVDPASAGLSVALRFFPDEGCDGQACDLGVCSKPFVSLGELMAEGSPLDTHEKALVSALKSKFPDGGTPMSAALGGAEMWAINHQLKNPAEKTVVVLVTDGEPNGCDEDIAHIAKLAADANSTAGVLTYAVGLAGSEQDQMNAIAAAGGTSQGFFIGSGDVTAQLIEAFKEIQGSSVGCEFEMPESTTGEPVDPELVNVTYVPGDGGEKVPFGQVATKDVCDTDGGWFYDDPVKPTTIALCPATCAAVQTDSKAKIEILLGCATTPAK